MKHGTLWSPNIKDKYTLWGWSDWCAITAGASEIQASSRLWRQSGCMLLQEHVHRRKFSTLWCPSYANQTIELSDDMEVYRVVSVWWYASPDYYLAQVDNALWNKGTLEIKPHSNAKLLWATEHKTQLLEEKYPTLEILQLCILLFPKIFHLCFQVSIHNLEGK